jgi:5-methylcytosine-specific restriction endonuclease McrA
LLPARVIAHHPAMPYKPPSLAHLQARPRVKTVTRGYGACWRKLRKMIAAERPAICVRCGHAGASATMHLDHVVPLARGGTNDPDNLQWLCGSCHSKKTANADGGFGR